MQLHGIFACVIALTACAGQSELEDGEHDDVSTGKADGSFSERDQLAALRVANDLTREQLDHEVGLSSRAAANIASQRAGRFATFAELDAVPYVGPIALADMVAYASARGWGDEGAPYGTPAAIQPAVQAVNEQFGRTMAFDGTTLVVGAPNTNTVYLYERSSSGWSPAATPMLKGPSTVESFGMAVAIDGDTLVIAGGALSARVYVYRRSGTAWTLETTLFGNTTQLNITRKGLALAGDTLVVGATNAGYVYIFKRTDTTWREYARLEDPFQDAPYSLFGSVVAIDGERIAVGEPTNSGGAVHLYQVIDNWWARTELRHTEGNVSFGASIALQGDTLVVGEPGTDGPEEEAGNIGSIVVYKRIGTKWQLESHIFAAAPVELAGFGGDLSLNGDVLAVGAGDSEGVIGEPGYTSGLGAVYLFARDGGAFHQIERRTSPNPQKQAHFGSRVILTDDTLIVAADRENGDRGTVYAD